MANIKIQHKLRIYDDGCNPPKEIWSLVDEFEAKLLAIGIRLTGFTYEMVPTCKHCGCRTLK